MNLKPKKTSRRRTLQKQQKSLLISILMPFMYCNANERRSEEHYIFIQFLLSFFFVALFS